MDIYSFFGIDKRIQELPEEIKDHIVKQYKINNINYFLNEYMYQNKSAVLNNLNILSIKTDSKVILINILSNLIKLEFNDNYIKSVKFNYEGEYLLIFSEKITLWSIKGYLVGELVHDNAKSVSFIHKTNKIITTSNTEIKIWEKDKLIHSIPEPNELICYNKTGNIILFSINNIVKVWENKIINTFTNDKKILFICINKKKILFADEYNVNIYNLDNNEIRKISYYYPISKIIFKKNIMFICFKYSTLSSYLYVNENLINQYYLNDYLRGITHGISNIFILNDNILICPNMLLYNSKTNKEDYLYIDSGTCTIKKILINRKRNRILGIFKIHRKYNLALRMWDENGTLITKFNKFFLDASFNYEGDNVFVLSLDKNIEIWDINGNLLKTLGSYTYLDNPCIKNYEYHSWEEKILDVIDYSDEVKYFNVTNNNNIIIVEDNMIRIWQKYKFTSIEQLMLIKLFSLYFLTNKIKTKTNLKNIAIKFNLDYNQLKDIWNTIPDKFEFKKYIEAYQYKSDYEPING